MEVLNIFVDYKSFKNIVLNGFIPFLNKLFFFFFSSCAFKNLKAFFSYPNAPMEIRLSSHKKGHGLKEIFSKDIQSYWSTDDTLPHGIQIKFNKLTYVEEVRIYLSYIQDDSYTPQEIEIRSGLVESEIEPITNLSLFEPEGFFSLAVKKKCFYLQIIILNNHQDGKDSHIRHLKIMESKNKEIFIDV